MSVLRLSVVVASCRSLDLLAQVVASLRPQCERAGAELIVARAGRETAEALAELLPGCRMVRCPTDAPMPVVRGAGLAIAEGEWVALTEDNCVPDPDWLAALSQAMGRREPPDCVVVGGVMDNGKRVRALDWGAFFAEYGFYGRGRGGNREPSLVTGANVAYHRAVLSEIAAWSREGAWEDVIHRRLAARGARFALAGRACVRQNLSYSLKAFCRDRFVHGRDFARVWGQGIGVANRLARALSAPVLPPVLAWRVWRATGREAAWAFVRALPVTLVFLAAWSLGEAWGYLRRAG